MNLMFNESVDRNESNVQSHCIIWFVDLWSIAFLLIQSILQNRCIKRLQAMQKIISDFACHYTYNGKPFQYRIQEAQVTSALAANVLTL